MNDTAQAIICQKIGNLFPYAIAASFFSVAAAAVADVVPILVSYFVYNFT